MKKKKTVYGIKTRSADSEEWSDASWYKKRANRDKTGSMCRIIGAIRTYSFEEKKTEEEIELIEFQD